MGGPRESVVKRWHSLRISPHRERQRWASPYWRDNEGFRDIACRECRRFDAGAGRCTISYGSPIRKCAAAAIEANLSDVNGGEALEIGFGRWKLARKLLRRCGCNWTGIDPGQARENTAAIGSGGYGHAADIPFPDASFDLVFGIQTFEHWGQKAGAAMEPSSYSDCLHEVLRVLKPGGRLYLDAPIHYHGNEMFVMGDLDRIVKLFRDEDWEDLAVERWRREHEPLERFMAPEKEIKFWPVETSGLRLDEIERIRTNASSWLITIKARKK